MWQCPDCSEQHEDSFGICWKCGADPAGNRDPDFGVSEPARDEDQAPETPVKDARPSLELPAITYFSIPPYICTLLILMVNDLGRAAVDRVSVPSALQIVVGCVGAVVIGIPVLVAIARVMFTCTSRRIVTRSVSEALWMTSMFRLPASISQSHPWFLPMYYGSIGALVIVPFGLGVRQVFLFTR